MSFRRLTLSVLHLSMWRNLASMLGIVAICALLVAVSAPAQALSLVEQAHVNVLEKLRPDIAGKIARKLDKIDKSNLTNRQKHNARKKLFSKQIEKARTAAKAADKYGDKNQKKAAKEALNVVSSLGLIILHYPKYKPPKSVKKEIKRLKKEAKKKSEEGKQKSASNLAGSDINFAFTGEVGKSYRKSSHFLRSEFGMMVINPKLLSFSNNDTSGGNTAEIKGSFAPDKVWGFGPKTYWKAGWNWYGTESKASADNLALNGDNLGIVSPEANGGLVGGIVINAGAINFSDLSNVRFKNHFYETNVFGEIGNDIDHNGGTLRPSIRVALGHSDLNEKLRGTTAAGTLDFDYKNSIMAWQGSIGAGLELVYPLGDFGGVPIEYYGSVSAAIRFYQFDGDSTLTTSGALNARERVNFDDFKVSYATQVYVGLSAEVAPALELTTGVRFRQTEAPRVEINGNEDAYIKLESAQEFTFALGLKMMF